MDAARRSGLRVAVKAGLIGLPLAGSLLVWPGVAGAIVPTQGAEAEQPGGAAQRPDGVATAPTPPAAQQDAVQAYLDAGYTYDDAVVLAQRWDLGDAFEAKVEAGGYLQAGTALADSPRATPEADDGYTAENLRDLFTGVGYTSDDAVRLAEAWNVDPDTAAAQAGGLLKTVGVLPFVDLYMPGPAEMTTFLDAGYDYDDAVLLAEHWGLPQPYDAKVKAGALLQRGEELPEVDGVAPNA